jgi:predicted RNA-binding Zn ribbon-like protein
MSITHDDASATHPAALPVTIAKDFSFVGRLCLDFAQTGDMGYGDRFERLTSPSELQRWLSLSPLALPTVGITRADVDDAKALRRAIWRLAATVLDREHPNRTDIQTLNRFACEPVLLRKLDLDARSMRWREPRIAAAFATIGQDAVVLFGEPAQRERLRRCENAGCRAVFYDESRPGQRRWCAASRCGDRMRAQAYRDRNRA